MQPFNTINGVVLPVDRANVDTDAIIPKQYLTSVHRSGFGSHLFADWRYADGGEAGGEQGRRLDPDCVLNQARYREAQILLTRANFGCGSSREHAVWALVDFGIRVVIGSGFADIFFANTLNNGLLAIILDEAIIDRLFDEVERTAGYRLTVDLEARTIATPTGEVVRFEIEEHRRHRLLHGLDNIGLTLAHAVTIHQYEQAGRTTTPWLFDSPVPS